MLGTASCLARQFGSPGPLASSTSALLPTKQIEKEAVHQNWESQPPALSLAGVGPVWMVLEMMPVLYCITRFLSVAINKRRLELGLPEKSLWPPNAPHTLNLTKGLGDPWLTCYRMPGFHSGQSVSWPG